MSELNVGDEVMMIEDELHAEHPEYYPAKSSIGVVVQYSPRDGIALVDWGQDSGVDLNEHDEYAWWCSVKRLEKVNANTQANTQKEVCNMSKFNVGDKVVFTNDDKHKRVSQFYPAVGTVGIIRDKDKNDDGVLIDWGKAEGVSTNGSYAAKAWWCEEKDIKLCEYTDDEVWEMPKPKMRQLVPAYIENLDMYSPIVKKMVVAAYRSGYGRATKGRSFIIKPKVDEKQKVDEKPIDDVLSGKMIVTIYTDLDNSYTVSEFDHALHSEQGVEIHGDIIYDSNRSLWADGFDVIGDPDCEMYVAISLSEAVEQFYGKIIKMMYCGDEQPVGLCNIKRWAIGEFNGFTRFGNETCAFMVLKHEDNNSLFYPEIHSPNFKALIPICDYLKHEGVNV